MAFLVHFRSAFNTDIFVQHSLKTSRQFTLSTSSIHKMKKLQGIIATNENWHPEQFTVVGGLQKGRRQKPYTSNNSEKS